MRLAARVGVAFALLVAPSAAVAQPSDTAAGAPPPPAADAAPPAHESGLLLELRYERNPATDVPDPFGGTMDLPEPQSAIFAGYQQRRWSFGIGLQLARTLQSTDDTSTDDDTSTTTYVLAPGVRVALGSSSDGRAELVAVLDLGFGETTRSFDNGANDITIDRFHVQIGPGVRYWLGPSFAFGASALIRHARARLDREDPFSGQSWTSETANTDLVTSLSVTGVF